MSNKTHLCKNFGQYCVAFTTLIVLTVSAHAREIKREPANFIPDDDMIVVPMVVEKSFYREFNEKHEDKFRESRLRLENWIMQEQYVQDYGLENTGFANNLPTAEDKERFLKRNYLRFIQKDVNRNNQETLQGWVNSWNTDDELNSIKNNEQRDEYIILSKRSRGEKVVTATETVKVGKSKFKIDFQPRIEMGMVRVKIKSEYFYMRAWVGINGRQEVYIDRNFKSTGTKVLANYYIDENRILAAARQSLGGNWSMRLTHEKFSKDFESSASTGLAENNILSIHFGMGF